MQRLTLSYLENEAVISLDAPTSDYRCAMQVEPAQLQGSFEDFCNGEDDGRGIPMAPGAYTAMGIQGVFYRMMGIEVGGVEDAPDDLDGVEAADPGELVDDEGEGEPAALLDAVDESLPRRVAEHYQLLAQINKT